ncbi:PaaI family thioesterase [Metabacillus lacus]|uniref:PaaI family thioesterase n=1 Tax=Metabacillus lacus TaxID=1983721 RepID=UPI0012B0491C|nr:PaaI family thioesterase [Metabacillus lacus]
MKTDFEKLLEDASDEEKEILSIVLQALERKRAKPSSSYIGGLLGAEAEASEDSSSFSISIPNTPLIQNALNIVHGGITATLLDSTMGSLVHWILPESHAAVTTEMKINYVAPGTGKQLTCKAELIHKGTKIVVTEGKVFRDDGVLLAHSTASFFIIERKQL